MNTKQKQLKTRSGLFLLFILYTISLKTIDVQKVGPQHSEVGYATINEYFFDKIGTSHFWYQVTDIIGVFPLMIMGYFAVCGLYQLCARKKLSLVDKEILNLGFLYFGIAVVYVFFEKVIINYRPILVEGHLEASYPSSHTFLAVAVLLSAFYLFKKEKGIKKIMSFLCLLVMSIIMIGRILSGVHWITDILGGILLGLSFVSFYIATTNKFEGIQN